MDLRIDVHSPEPSYLQLAARLRAAIESGEIGPRQPLPSLSRLVQETGLAGNTVRHAISVLTEEGLVYTVRGRGTFATPRQA
jgi:GntR family transcriptional regulator